MSGEKNLTGKGITSWGGNKKKVNRTSPAKRSQLASVPIAPALPPISTTSKPHSDDHAFCDHREFYDDDPVYYDHCDYYDHDLDDHIQRVQFKRNSDFFECMSMRLLFLLLK